MLQNQNDSQDDDCFSLCSSCKSELRSFFSLGVPSYLNASAVSNASSIPHDDLQMPEIVNDAVKTMQSVSTSKWRSQDESAVCLSTEESERLKSARRATPPDNSRIEIQNKLSSEHADNHSNGENRTQNDRNAPINMTLLTHKAQKLNDITNRNPKSRAMGIAVNDSRNAKYGGDEAPKLSNCIESCNVLSTNNTMEIKASERSGQITTALAAHNLQKLREMHGVMFSQNNADIQTAPGITTSRALVDSSRRVIIRETVDVDNLANRRRNVCKLATRILKFSAYIRKVQKVLLGRYRRGARIPRNEREEASSTDEIISDTDSYIKNVAPQDLPMYNYNPLRMKRKPEIKRL